MAQSKTIEQLKQEIYEAQPDKQIVGQSLIRLMVETGEGEIRVGIFESKLDEGIDPIEALASVFGTGSTRSLLTNSLNLISTEKRSKIEVTENMGYEELTNLMEDYQQDE